MIKNLDKHGQQSNATVVASVSLVNIAALWNRNHRAIVIISGTKTTKRMDFSDVQKCKLSNCRSRTESLPNSNFCRTENSTVERNFESAVLDFFNKPASQ